MADRHNICSLVMSLRALRKRIDLLTHHENHDAAMFVVPPLNPMPPCRVSLLALHASRGRWQRLGGSTPTDVCRSIDSLSVWPLPSDPVLFWAPLCALCQMIEIRIYCHGSLAVAGTGPTPTHACMRACAVAAGHGDYSTRRHESSDLTQVPNQSNPIPSRPAGDLCRRTSASDHGVRGHCLQLLRNLSVAHLSPSNMTTQCASQATPSDPGLIVCF